MYCKFRLTNFRKENNLMVQDQIKGVSDFAFKLDLPDLNERRRKLLDYIRYKKYVKTMTYENPRLWEFHEPFYSAQMFYYYNEYVKIPISYLNMVPMIQLAGCNLKCKWCFLDPKMLAADSVTSEEVYFDPADMKFVMKNIYEKLYENEHGVFRISGGEPFLQVNELIDFLNAYNEMPGNQFFWVDTNLFAPTSNYFLFKREIKTKYNIGLCMCIKGFNSEEVIQNTGHDILETQLENLYYILKEIKPEYYHIYVPELLHTELKDAEDVLKVFMERLFKISPKLPLKVGVLTIKPYLANSDFSKEYANIEKVSTRNLWNSLLIKKYGDLAFELNSFV